MRWAISPSSTYRVLKAAGLLQRWNPKPSRKGQGFQQPLEPHEHWHVDISYLNMSEPSSISARSWMTVRVICCIGNCAPQMTELDVEIILQRARERYPDSSPRIITDTGPQFIVKDFKEFIRLAGLTHVRTSLITRKATVTSSHGTAASNSIVSGQAGRFLRRRRLDLSSALLPITTPCDCIRPSAISPRLIGSPARTSRSSQSQIANSNSLAKTDKLNDNP